MLITLAVSDNAAIGMWAVQVATTVVMGFALFRLGVGQRRMEKSEDARQLDMKALKQEVAEKDGKLHQLAEKLVDERFRSMTHEINEHVGAFKVTLENAGRQIEKAEGDVEKIVEAAHKAELTSRDKLDQVKDYVRDHAASKSDMKEHQRQVNEQFGKLDAKLERFFVASATAAAKANKGN
jgi:chromosome segregation ATPase